MKIILINLAINKRTLQLYLLLSLGAFCRHELIAWCPFYCCQINNYSYDEYIKNRNDKITIENMLMISRV